MRLKRLSKKLSNRSFFFWPVFLLILIHPALLPGCSSFEFPTNESWTLGEKKEAKGSVRIISVSVERSGEQNSLEKEISDMLPLLFSEESYLVVSSSAASDYLAAVKVREREYPDGWQMLRSLSVELRLWANVETDETGDSEPPLLSAGRSIVQGTKSLASSVVLSDMLRKAVKNALNGLGSELTDTEVHSTEEPATEALFTETLFTETFSTEVPSVEEIEQ